MKKAINIRIDEDILSDLDSYAHELERTRTFLIEKAVSAYFDTLDEVIADKRINGLKSSKTTAISLEEVFAKAGISV